MSLVLFACGLVIVFGGKKRKFIFLLGLRHQLDFRNMQATNPEKRKTCIAFILFCNGIPKTEIYFEVGKSLCF